MHEGQEITEPLDAKYDPALEVHMTIDNLRAALPNSSQGYSMRNTRVGGYEEAFSVHRTGNIYNDAHIVFRDPKTGRVFAMTTEGRDKIAALVGK